MIPWKKYLAAIVSIVALVTMFGAGATMALAQGPEGGPGKGPGGGAGGEVTAVSSSSLTILTPNDESLTVKFTDKTEVRLVESGSDGSLSDIDVGDQVRVHGLRNDDGTIEARMIAVEPEGDRLGGRGTEIDGTTITVETRDGEATLTVSDSTTYRDRDGAASLADITEDSFVMAFGELDDDGSLSARLVMVGGGPGQGGGPGGDGQHPAGPPPGPRPERGSEQ
ncbi:MAG TPA: DUF5666 domain-containing protein [Anaerolineae bacterium]|nr:DUF5666 domain-containing protein [Anaerolineae bacterium]